MRGLADVQRVDHGRADPVTEIEKTQAIRLADVFFIGPVARMTRAACLETFGQDHVRTARAKGMTRPRVIYVHALRNALLPAVTILGLKSAEMLGGAILTETIFAWPGIGRYMFEAIRNRDFPVIQGTTLVFALIYVMTSLAVDFIHGALDPRVRRKML